MRPGDDLAAAAAVLDAGAAAGQGEDAPEAPESVPAASGDELRPILIPAVAIVGNGLCDRYRVTRLEGDEAGVLADALIRLADAYDLRVTDPKVAAWLGLGAAAALVYKNRRPLPAAEPKPDASVETQPA